MSNFYSVSVGFVDGDRLMGRCFEGEGTLVNRHLAYLFAYSDHQDFPYFALSAKEKERVYTRSPHVKFEPSSVYTSVKDTPITGLSMIGLFPNHNPFFDCTMFDAWIKIAKLLKKSRNSGLQLDQLFNYGAVLASKVHGPKGCGVIEFLTQFLRQFGCYNYRLKFDGPFPWELDENGQPRRIPLLSPMSVCSWNSDLVNLFESIMPAGEQPCLGFYRQGNERCNSTAYYFDKFKPVETEADDDTLKKAMDFLGIKYPEPFVRPRFGRMSMLNDFPRNAVFAMECKQDVLSSSDIVNIVVNKFTEEEVGGCQLFFIFTTRISDDAVKELCQELHKQKDPESEDSSLNGVLFWKLNVDVGRGDARTGDALTFTLDKIPLPPSRANQPIKKHVILLALETIWIRNFKRNYRTLRPRK